MISFRLRAKRQNCRGYVPSYEQTPKNGWFDIHSVFATHVETVCLLYHQKKEFISVPYEPKDAEYLKSYPGTATYEEIKEWILTKYNFKVSSLYVAQVKAKHGLEMRDCYNRPRSENSRQPQVPKEKEKMIEEALRHFRMIEN